MRQPLFMLLLLFSTFAYTHGQSTSAQKIKNGIWFHPNNVSKINGVAIGPFNIQKWNKYDRLVINGLNLELIGGSLFLFLPLPQYPERTYITVNGLCLSPFFWGGTNNGVTISVFPAMSNMKGVNLGILSGVNENSRGFNFGLVAVGSNTMKGVQIGGFNRTTVGSGVLIGGVECTTDTMQGISISAINTTKKLHRGVQIGLINYTKNLRGIQIGLFNYARNSKHPFTILFNMVRKKRVKSK